MAVVFKSCPLFKESLFNLARNYPNLINRLDAFRDFKRQNPLASFGSSDKPAVSKLTFSNEIPGIRHAHLTKDISVWYTVSGRDPIEIKLYGVFTHHETGTSTTPNQKRQMSTALRFKNQKFS